MEGKVLASQGRSGGERGGWGGRKDNIDIPGETRAQIRVTQDGGG